MIYKKNLKKRNFIPTDHINFLYDGFFKYFNKVYLFMKLNCYLTVINKISASICILDNF